MNKDIAEAEREWQIIYCATRFTAVKLTAMTAEERAEYERREAIRAARFEAFALRTIEAQKAAERAAQKLLSQRLSDRRKQLDFAI